MRKTDYLKYSGHQGRYRQNCDLPELYEKRLGIPWVFLAEIGSREEKMFRNHWKYRPEHCVVAFIMTQKPRRRPRTLDSQLFG